MTEPSDAAQPWDHPQYECIASAHCGDDRQCTVTFANGDVVSFDLAALVPSETDLDDVDWWRVAANEMELIVPISDSWFEIPWDVIRRHTDPEYEAYWALLTQRGMQNTGKRVRKLREDRGLSLREVAERAGWTIQLVTDVEEGGADPWLDLRPLLSAMGYTYDYLSESAPDLALESSMAN